MKPVQALEKELARVRAQKRQLQTSIEALVLEVLENSRLFSNLCSSDDEWLEVSGEDIFERCDRTIDGPFEEFDRIKNAQLFADKYIRVLEADLLRSGWERTQKPLPEVEAIQCQYLLLEDSLKEKVKELSWERFHEKHPGFRTGNVLTTLQLQQAWRMEDED